MGKKLKIIATVVLLMCVLLGIYAFINKDRFKLDPNAKDYVSELKDPKTFNKDNQILIPGFDNIQVSKNYKEKGLQLFNPQKNDVYFQYTVTLDDSNKVLCKTDLIPPGKSVEVLPWANLNPGNYDITIKIQTYSLKNSKETLNGANLKIKMNILKD